jgi:hypothetical protein
MPVESVVEVLVDYHRYNLMDGWSDVDLSETDLLSDGLTTPLPINSDTFRAAVVGVGVQFGPLPVTVVVHEEPPGDPPEGLVVSEFDLQSGSGIVYLTDWECRHGQPLVSGEKEDRWRVRVTAEHRDVASTPPDYDRTRERHRIELWRSAAPSPWAPTRYIDYTGRVFRDWTPPAAPFPEPQESLDAIDPAGGRPTELG